MSATGNEAVTMEQLKIWFDSLVPPVEIVSWADGTDEQIAAMVVAADAGLINLSDYWHEGDTRTVHLSAMSNSVPDILPDAYDAQDVQFTLTDPGHYTLVSGKPCNFVVLQKGFLKPFGQMNSNDTNSGGWDACPRRTWCNSVYYNAVPGSLRGIFKQFKVSTANGSGSGVTESTDWFSLFSEKEIFGSTTYANATAEANNSQLTWFKTPSNRIYDDFLNVWWERSPSNTDSRYFCCVSGNEGIADHTYARYSSGLAPFGCI